MKWSWSCNLIRNLCRGRVFSIPNCGMNNARIHSSEINMCNPYESKSHIGIAWENWKKKKRKLNDAKASAKNNNGNCIPVPIAVVVCHTINQNETVVQFWNACGETQSLCACCLLCACEGDNTARRHSASSELSVCFGVLPFGVASDDSCHWQNIIYVLCVRPVMIVSMCSIVRLLHRKKKLKCSKSNHRPAQINNNI